MCSPSPLARVTESIEALQSENSEPETSTNEGTSSLEASLEKVSLQPAEEEEAALEEEEAEEESETALAMSLVEEEVSKLRKTGRQRVRTRHGKKKLSRENLVQTVLALFEKITPRELVGELAISFDGEEAIDAGGVTNEMFTQFFIAIFDPKMGYFEPAAGGHTLLPTVLEKYSKQRLKEYENIGKVMIKAALDRIPIPRGLAGSLFVFLSAGASGSLGLEELQEFDPTVARTTNFVLEQEDQEMLEAMCLTFPETSEEGEETEVSLSNKEAFAQAMVRHVLVASREAPLEALSRGFQAIPTLNQKLVALSPSMMQTIVCGPESIDVEQLLTHLHIVEDDFGGSEVPAALKSVLQSWEEPQLSQFLSFTTGVANMLPDGSMENKDANPQDKIKVMRCLCKQCKAANAGDTTEGCGSLPVASTCFWTLRLPICNDPETLKGRFRLAFEWGQGFGDL